MSTRDDVRTGVGFAFAAYFVWGMVTVYWKTVDQFDPFELIAWRITTSFVVLAVVLIVMRKVRLVVSALSNPRLAMRITVAGQKHESPADAGDDDVALAKNRRVEVEVVQ